MLQNATYFQELQNYRDKYRSYEERAPEDIFEEILRECTHVGEKGKKLIQAAYELTKKGHKNQLRKSGRPYITHPLTIACMSLPHKPCEILIASILLHDVLEDTDLTYDDLVDIHPTIADIVEGATKIRAVSRAGEEDFSPEEAKFETIRKILVASHKDIRILFLKVFDRLHNMITVDAMSPEGRHRIALETKNVYVPLAKRCGLREVHHYLQGLSTEVLEPERWETMKIFVENKYGSMVKTANTVREHLLSESWSKKIIKLDTRFLSPFSVELTKAYHEESWYSIQVIVQKGSDCYAILHDIGSRQDENLLQVGKINDLINQPRLSSYEGLHFDVVFQGIYRIKIRVLTQETYDRICSYPTFDQLGMTYSPVLFRDFELINEATASDSKEFMQSVTEHILARKIPLHSEARPLFYLPIKSTALDAAIYLSSSNFDHINALYRNGEKVPLHTALEDNDIVKFEYTEKKTIKKQWLNFVHSGVSKWRIRNHLLKTKEDDRN